MLPNETFISESISESNAETRQNLCLLGSTGSIGTQTLDIVRLFPQQFKVLVLTAGKNAALLAQQALEFAPKCVVIQDKTQVAFLQDRLKGTGIQIWTGDDALCEVVTMPEVDKVVAAMVGFAGLKPTIAAIEAGKTIALANKETLVVAGALIADLAKRNQTSLLPIDSEHSAIFQCLVGEAHQSIEALILTASGGPFRTRAKDTFKDITKAEALRHPNWTMGAKITIDSATMMNKGLEIIEARWLFDLEAERIKVLVHPQSIIHSLVAFRDGSTKAQLGVPDMKVPIQYALTFPQRWHAPHERLDWSAVAKLDFEAPDLDKFPCLRLAYEALEMGGNAPAILNAANEQAVALFLNEEIRFIDIPLYIEQALTTLANTNPVDLSGLYIIDTEARRLVKELKPVFVH
jgi:1-deoxy-D-xylulose-5-phosphate reductoisomerase